MENTNTKIIQEIPADLQFVWDSYEPKAIADNFLKKYAQEIPETDLQQKFKKLPFSTATLLTREETFVLYGITETHLHSVYKNLEKKALESGVSIEHVGMGVFSEDVYYGNDHTSDSENKVHAETARSDGKNLLLEKDLTKAGGIQGRIYDLLHLAFGHMVQWSTNDKGTLLSREEAWSIGYRNHEKSPARVLDLMSLYEFEAGMQGIEALSQVLDESELSNSQKEAIIQYFVDYAYADRDYIIQHYRGNHESFQKFWKFGQPIPPRQVLPGVKKFIERYAVEIGLIRDKQK